MKLLEKIVLNFHELTKKIDWKLLSGIGQNEFVKKILIWVIIVPIFAKVFSKLENTFVFSFNDKKYILDLVLPFSWSIFYFAAISFLIGNMVYKIFIPLIIIENKSYSDFLATGKGKNELRKYLDNEKLSTDDFYYLEKDELLSESLKYDYYYLIFEQTNLLYKKARLIIFIFYSTGILLVSYTFIENFIYVISQITTHTK